MRTGETLSDAPWLVLLRRTNMSRACAFVKHVNTTYSAFVLGHSQDVDIFASSETAEAGQPRAARGPISRAVGPRGLPLCRPGSSRRRGCWRGARPQPAGRIPWPN